MSRLGMDRWIDAVLTLDWQRTCFGLSGWSKSVQGGILVNDCHPKWQIGIRLALDWKIGQRLAFPGIGV